MKVNYKNQENISFKSFWSRNSVKKGLEFASNNGALFAATTTLALSAGVRPLAIMATPDTKKENKSIACAKSIISGLLEFGLTLAISAPIAAAFKKIDKNPEKFLKKETVKALINDSKSLKESKAYSLATQLFKLGLGFAVVIPKSILTAMGIPYILDNCLNKKESLEQNQGGEISFQGKNDNIAKFLGKILDKKALQEFAIKHKESNFPLHIFALKDIFATAAFIQQSNKNKKIKEEQKPFLAKNSIISTALSLFSSYTIDKLTDKQAEKIINKIKQENINDPRLHKYLEGFKIIKPIFILAIVYYTIIPIVSTYLADMKKQTSKN